MRSRSTLPALLLIIILPMLACQYLAAGPSTCRVELPGSGQVQYRQGDEVAFTEDGIGWKAMVDCKSGQLVDGDPVRPERAREILIPVEDTTYRLITSDPGISMTEFRGNGSHVRIDDVDSYYHAVLEASPASFGSAMMRFFMAGQTDDGVVHVHCYNRTEGEEHTSVPGLGAMWTTSRPTTVALVCSGRDFILEFSTKVTPVILRQGPTLIPPTPGPTPTPEPPGSHL